MATDYLFGWDLLYQTIKKDIKSKSDIIIVLTHWYLIKNSFLCVGLSDDKTLGEYEYGNELLPNFWNDNDETYTLRYISKDRSLYILLGSKFDNHIILNFLNVKTMNVSNLTINFEIMVKSFNDSNIKTIIPEINILLDRFQKELLNPVFIGNTKEVETQTIDTSKKFPIDSFSRQFSNETLLSTMSNPINRNLLLTSDSTRLTRFTRQALNFSNHIPHRAFRPRSPIIQSSISYLSSDSESDNLRQTQTSLTSLDNFHSS